MKIINNLPIKTDIQEQIGNLNHLNTFIKTNLVSAVNWLYKNIMDKIGSADISGAGDGTITGAISSLDSVSKTLHTAAFQEVANNDTTSDSGYVADARIVKMHGDEIDSLKAAGSSLSETLTKSIEKLGSQNNLGNIGNEQKEIDLSPYRYLAIRICAGGTNYQYDYFPVSLFSKTRRIHTVYWYSAADNVVADVDISGTGMKLAEWRVSGGISYAINAIGIY